MEAIRLRSGVTSGESVTLRLSPETCFLGMEGVFREVFAPSDKKRAAFPLIGKFGCARGGNEDGSDSAASRRNLRRERDAAPFAGDLLPRHGGRVSRSLCAVQQKARSVSVDRKKRLREGRE